MSDHYKQYYDLHACRFDSLRLDGAEEIDLFIQYASSWSAGSSQGIALEVGCGTGRYASAVAKSLMPCVGVDRSEQQLRYAPKDICVVNADATALPFAKNTFTLCFAILMLHQNDREGQKQILREMLRVLKTSSPLIIKTCSHADLERRPFNDIFPSSVKLNEKRYPSLNDLNDWLKSMSVDQIRIVPTHTQTSVDGDLLIKSYEGKHNTTLALIPRQEFERGLAEMRRRLQKKTVTFDNWHTIVAGTKG